MLIEKNNIDIDEFIRKFNYKFQNFCKKSPMFLSYTIIPNKGVSLYECSSSKDGDTQEKIKDFEFDFSIDVKSNIFNIKQYLIEHCYPRLFQRKWIIVPSSPKEMNDMIEKQEITLDDVVGNNKYRKLVVYTWIIEKVIFSYDEIFVRFLDENKLLQYKCKMPVSIFLQKIRKMDEYDSWEFFKEKSIFMHDKTTSKNDVKNFMDSVEYQEDNNV